MSGDRVLLTKGSYLVRLFRKEMSTKWDSAVHCSINLAVQIKVPVVGILGYTREKMQFGVLYIIFYRVCNFIKRNVVTVIKMLNKS
jgi:hypothetical protein